MSLHLYYIHDPMCSWCWGFRPVWEKIQQALPVSLSVQYILGGLAPDTDELMPMDMQQHIVANWQRIQQVIPGTDFNYDFWTACKPRRSTYPACRAMLAAKQQDTVFEQIMLKAIQHAYYLQAKNPSDDATLIDLAVNIGLDKKQFNRDLNSQVTQDLLAKNIQHYHQLTQQSGASGFPSLVLQTPSEIIAVPRDYLNPEAALIFIQQAMAQQCEP
jgi:putative protein-disulfide isomerase